MRSLRPQLGRTPATTRRALHSPQERSVGCGDDAALLRLTASSFGSSRRLLMILNILAHPKRRRYLGATVRMKNFNPRPPGSGRRQGTAGPGARRLLAGVDLRPRCKPGRSWCAPVIAGCVLLVVLMRVEHQGLDAPMEELAKPHQDAQPSKAPCISLVQEWALTSKPWIDGVGAAVR